MNQIFSFKKEMKQPILDGIKYFTTREETPFRLKCDVGDTMYHFTGIRTEDAEKFAEAIVVKRWRWSIKFPKECPVGISWDEFSIAEGFDDFEGLKGFFLKKLITYQFELIE
jgi:hypothetical protein